MVQLVRLIPPEDLVPRGSRLIWFILEVTQIKWYNLVACWQLSSSLFEMSMFCWFKAATFGGLSSVEYILQFMHNFLYYYKLMLQCLYWEYYLRESRCYCVTIHFSSMVISWPLGYLFLKIIFATQIAQKNLWLCSLCLTCTMINNLVFFNTYYIYLMISSVNCNWYAILPFVKS